MMIPTVHLNGTHGPNLLDQVTDASQAAWKLMKALENMSPHGRDYYVQSPSAFKQAQMEHEDRYKLVKSLLDELEQLAEGIADQLD